MNRMLKRAAFIWNRSLVYIIYVFTVTSDEFNASLLNKSMNLFKNKKKNLTHPKLLNGSLYQSLI